MGVGGAKTKPPKTAKDMKGIEVVLQEAFELAHSSS